MTQLLPLPISPKDFNEQILTPAFALLPMTMDSVKARVQLTATALQESGLRVRWQELAGGAKGPARGLLQFERGTLASRGGVWGVFTHHQTAATVLDLCKARDVAPDPWPIWSALERDDILCAALGRLLLWTDSRPLPEAGASTQGWSCYERNWRPGKPHPERWPKNYAAAMEAVVGA